MLRHDEEGVATRTRFWLESTSFPVCRTAILPMRGVAPGRKRKTPAWFRQANSLHRKDLSTPRRASVELAGRHHNGSITVTHYRRPSESCQKNTLHCSVKPRRPGFTTRPCRICGPAGAQPPARAWAGSAPSSRPGCHRCSRNHNSLSDRGRGGLQSRPTESRPPLLAGRRGAGDAA